MTQPPATCELCGGTGLYSPSALPCPKGCKDITADSDLLERALSAALSAEVIQGIRVDEYLSYTANDAVELGVLLTHKNDDGSPRFCRITDIMADEYDDVNRAILRPLIKAAIDVALSEAEKREKDARAKALEEAAALAFSQIDAPGLSDNPAYVSFEPSHVMARKIALLITALKDEVR